MVNRDLSIFAIKSHLSFGKTICKSFDFSFFHITIQREPGDMMTFKLVELQNMAVYVNVGGESFSDLSRDDLLEKMSTSNRGNLNRNNYVIGPVTANAMIRRNCSEKPLNSKKTPRVSCNLELGAMEFRISDEQYQSCVMAGRTIHQLHRNRKFWRWRPHEPVLGNEFFRYSQRKKRRKNFLFLYELKVS